jgi:hypothetical protein
LSAQQIRESGFPAAGRGNDTREIEPLARSTYRELRDGGFSDADIMAFAGELLSLIASDVRSTAAAE